MRSRNELTALCVVLFSLLFSAFARAQLPADEAALLAVWKNVAATNNDAAVKACATFQKQYAASPLSLVTRGLAGWQALKLGDRGETVTKLFESMITDSSDPFHEAAATMARRWLTRLDREKVKVALRKAYVEHVAYPPTLDEVAKLAGDPKPPLVDRWNRPWRYRPAEFKHIRQIAGQKFVLESVNIDRDHDLKEALGRSYEVATQLKPQKILSREKGRESVSFLIDRNPVVLAPGGRNGNVTFAYAGQGIVVLTDNDHWTVLALP